MTQDPIIEAAEKELADLMDKCIEIEAFIARYKKYKQTSQAAQAEAGEPAQDDVQQSLPGPARKAASSSEIMSAVHDILSDRGDALTLTAIFILLCERGIEVGGKNPKQNLSQKLSACDQLKSYGKRGWYFADTIPPSVQSNPQILSLSHNEKDPDDRLAGSSQSIGTEAVISRSTSVPSGRDNYGSAFVSSAPQHAEWEH